MMGFGKVFVTLVVCKLPLQRASTVAGPGCAVSLNSALPYPGAVAVTV
jgi:hypothetical protein